ncbi:MAG: hypothetical protein WCQ32_01060 [bacterium]
MKKQLCYKKIIGITLGVLTIGFIYHNSKDALFGAKLSVTIAPDGSTITDSTLPIEGYAPKVKSVTINQHPVAIDTAGHFKDEVLLSPGYNIIEVSTIDSFNKKTTKEYHLVDAPPTKVAAIPEKSTNGDIQKN